jgi:centrosomal protein CEP19
MADHHHKIFNSNDYIPKRFGLNYSPPQIIIEYLAPSTGKLYHHKMRLHKFKKEKNNAEIIKELYERHQVYLDKKKVSSEQLIRLIERLKQNFVPRKKKNDAKKEENKNDEKKEIKKEVKQEEKKEEKKEEKSSEIEEDFDFGEVESSMKEEKEKDKDKKKEIEKPKEVEKKKEKNDPELEEEEEEYGFDEFEDEDLNKLNDSELKKKKAEMDVEFEKNNIKKDDANFKYDIRKEFDHEQYAAEWDDESY